MERTRILVIGLDGATFDLIEPWAAAGDLPNLKQLIEGGTAGRLASTLQPVTAPAWTTFMTGVFQGKHGLYDFIRRRPDGYGMEVTSSVDIHAPTIFEIASQQGRRVVSINVPYTFPPRPVNGVMISGPFAPSATREAVYPPDFYDTLRRVAPGYFILPDYDARAPDPLADYAQKLLREIDVREQLALHLLQNEDWDLFTVVFMATDEVQHAFWHCLDAPQDDPAARYRNTIRDVYRRADQAIGRLLEQAQAGSPGRETIVILLSDHGAGPLRWMINLNRWLAEAGFLTFRPAAANRTRRLRAAAVKKLALLYRRALPAGLRAGLRARLGARRFSRLKGEVESELFTAPVDWERTRAYTFGAGGNIFVNLKGREPSGVVEPGAEYEQVRDEIIQALAGLRDPETGEAIVARAHRRETLYHGPYLERAPDIVVEWKDYTFWGRGRYDSLAPVFEAHNRLAFSDLPLTGVHRPEGILILHGRGVRPAGRIAEATLADLAPTILGLLELAVPEGLDGRFLAEAFETAAGQPAVQTGAGSVPTAPGPGHDFTPEEVEEIARRLRSLGYL